MVYVFKLLLLATILIIVITSSGCQQLGLADNEQLEQRKQRINELETEIAEIETQIAEHEKRLENYTPVSVFTPTTTPTLIKNPTHTKTSIPTSNPGTTATITSKPVSTSTPTSKYNSESVSVYKTLGSDTTIMIRGNGEAWVIEKGIGCLGLDLYEGRQILIESPGLFAGVGSNIILPECDQQCLIWDSECLGLGSFIVDSQIDGEFQGWDGDTIFRLRNAQVWQQVSFDYHYHYAFNPDVLIFSTRSGQYKMIVEDVSKTVYVEQLNSAPLETPTPTSTTTSTSNTWIDEYFSIHSDLPLVPEWLAPLIIELETGDKIRLGVTMTRPSAQFWARRSPSEKQMILETVSWLGGDPDDYLWQIEQCSPP